MYGKLFTLSCTVLGVLVSHAHAESAVQAYSRIQAKPVLGECVNVEVDLSAGPLVAPEESGLGGTLVLPMVNNNVAEGWSWQQGSIPSEQDFYRFKFLPLASNIEHRGEYQGEDKIGETQTMNIEWRYDYFLAFDNLYDFYPRSDADNAGFVLHRAPQSSQSVGVKAQLCLTEPTTTESTTFWKATHGKPTDLTLKKRYLIGKLKQIEFYDRATGAQLEIVKPLSS